MAYQQGPPHQQPPHYGPPPGYGYPPSPPKRGKGPLFWIFAIGLPLMLLFSCTAAVIVVGSSASQTLTPPAGTQRAQQKPSDTAAPAEQQPVESQSTQQAEVTQPAAPVELVSAEGSGTKNTSTFTADATWELRYSFDCSGFVGGKGNFIVTLKDDKNSPVGFPVNALAEKGEDKTPLYDAGTFHLEVVSTCKWKLKAVDLP